MNKKKLLSFAIALLLGVSSTFAQKQPVDYVNPLMGTDSKISLSNGNTYPAIALPWGMNFWMPQTGKMGDGWQYVYTANKLGLHLCIRQNQRFQANASAQSVDQ